ncbi:unnamed protein product, partial [Prorocentrum cordatum]
EGPPPARRRRRALVVGGGLGGLAAARELRRQFRVTVVDAKEYFEFAPGILRAFVEPRRWDSLTFLYKDVLEGAFGVGFIWGEVLAIDGDHREARVRPVFGGCEDVVPYDFCILAVGCGLGGLTAASDTPWLPRVRAGAGTSPGASSVDERFLEGRRRRVLEEHAALQELGQQQARVLVVGAGFLGVEWACELRHFVPGLRVTLCDFLPGCLGPLPQDAVSYCQEYMERHGIQTLYGVQYDPLSPQFQGFERVYVLQGPRHSNHFMPESTLSDWGPSGGGWILVNRYLQVVTRDCERWGHGLVFAAGDCSIGSAVAGRRGGDEAQRQATERRAMPKTGHSAEQQAIQACRNACVLDRHWYGGPSWCCGCFPVPGCLGSRSLRPAWYHGGSSIFAVSMGPQDGCLVVGLLPHKRGSGRVISVGLLAAAQKELIETTKLAHCQGGARPGGGAGRAPPAASAV